MHERKLKYLTKSKMIFPHQYGFIWKRSAADAILDFYDQSHNSFESKQLLVTVLLDLSKAFDTIGHVILWRK